MSPAPRALRSCTCARQVRAGSSSPATIANGRPPGRTARSHVRPEAGVSAQGLTLTTTTTGRSALGTIRKAAAKCPPLEWALLVAMGVHEREHDRPASQRGKREEPPGLVWQREIGRPPQSRRPDRLALSGRPDAMPALPLLSRCTPIPSSDADQRSDRHSRRRGATADPSRLHPVAGRLGPVCSRVPSCGHPVPQPARRAL